MKTSRLQFKEINFKNEQDRGFLLWVVAPGGLYFGPLISSICAYIFYSLLKEICIYIVTS